MKKILESILEGFRSIAEGMKTFKIYPSNKIESPREIREIRRKQEREYWSYLNKKYNKISEDLDNKYENLI